MALAGPVEISQLGHTLILAVDTIVVGQYAGTTSLTAISLVHSVFMVVLVIGTGLAFGLTPLMNNNLQIPIKPNSLFITK